MVWPAVLSSVVDGAPLQSPLEAILIGLVVPALIWLHPFFLTRTPVRVAIALILLTKIGGAALLQQQGWCLAFDPPYPMVRESTGKPHSWDIRADWLADDPVCSAIMSRSYHDSFELPVWFYNLPPPNDAVVRDGFHPGQIPVRVRGTGFISVTSPGRLRLATAPMMNVAATINGLAMQQMEPGQQEIPLPAGVHALQFEGTLLGKHWPIVPTWNGIEMGSMRFPLATPAPPSKADRLVGAWAGGPLLLLILALIGAWGVSAIRAFTDRPLLIWSAASSIAIAVVAVALPGQAPWYAAGVLALALLIPARARFENARGLFFLIVVPWLTFACAFNFTRIGRWQLYGIGNDNFLFQRFSYRVFMQHFWLEGGQLTFWNQPLYRWIAGVLHMTFGDSSVGQVYWDAAGIAFMALFASRIVAPLAGFNWGLAAAVTPFAMFLLGPGLEFVGFGLSEIASAAFIYLAVFFAIRRRGAADLVAAGALVVLGFYTRLNNLPMAAAVAAFALPIATPARLWVRPLAWWRLVQWRVVFAIAIALAIGGILFAWRTWYYTGVFDLFHGTQREFLAVWKPGMTWTQAVPAMISSLMMVLTGTDPPAFMWYASPIVFGAAIAVAALAGVPLFRDAPLPVVLFFVAGASGAVVTRGWGHEGRFSLHLYGAASALCWWTLAAAWARVQSGVVRGGRMTSIRRLAWATTTAIILAGALLPAQQGTLSPAEQQRRKDLEAELQSIAVVERRVMIPMKDGVRLATDIYRPKNAPGPVPTIFVKTPYNMNFWDVRNGVPADMSRIIEAIKRGYAYVGQNERGHFYSEGNYDILGAPITDGYETVEYLTKQPWSNGKLGTTGCSSTAEWQPAVASLGHPGFAAMNVQGFGAGVGKVGPYWEQGNWYRGGAMQMLFITWIYGEQNQVRPMFPRDTPREDLIAAGRLFDLAPRMPPVDWDKALWHLPTQDIIKNVNGPRGIFADRMPVETGGMMQQREPASDAWRKGGLWHDDMALNVPGLWFMSWYDVSVGPNLEMFNHVRRTAKPPVRDQQWAIIAPVAHCAFTRTSEHTIVGERDMGDARFDYNEVMYGFFDKFLKGDQAGRIEKLARVNYYTMGSNKWQTSDVWPPAGAQPMTFHLSSGGRANSLNGDGQLTAAPPETDAPDVFTYDPMNPVMSYGGNVCCTGNAITAGSFDQRKMESRHDILVYTTEPFKEGIEVSGPIVPTLYVSSDAKDTDFTVKVLDVYPDGRAFNLDESIQRMRYRDGYEKKVWMEKDKVYKVALQPLNTSNYFAAGHRLRIEVSSSNFPRFDRNLNTGGNNFDEAKGVVAKNAVHHSRQYPSSLTITVVKPSTATSARQ